MIPNTPLFHALLGGGLFWLACVGLLIAVFLADIRHERRLRRREEQRVRASPDGPTPPTQQVVGQDEPIHMLFMFFRGQRFIVRFSVSRIEEAREQLKRWAIDPELPEFGWPDVAILGEQLNLIKEGKLSC